MLQKSKITDWDRFNPKLFQKVNYLTKDICIELINFAENETKFVEYVSNNKVWSVNYKTTGIPITSELNDRLHKLLEPVWEEAIAYYNFDVLYTEPYEIKKYEVNDFVSDHEDQFFGSGENERKLSMVVQLSNKTEYWGGNLRLLRRFDCTREIGSIFIFPSFYLHEVTKVTKGVRYSINSWAWGPNWK